MLISRHLSFAINRLVLVIARIGQEVKTHEPKHEPADPLDFRQKFRKNEGNEKSSSLFYARTFEVYYRNIESSRTFGLLFNAANHKPNAVHIT